MTKMELKKIRNTMNMDPSAFAKFTGFSIKSIQAMEAGTREVSPRIVAILRNNKGK